MTRVTAATTTPYRLNSEKEMGCPLRLATPVTTTLAPIAGPPRHGKQILPHAVGGAGDYRRRDSIEAMKLAAWESDYVFQVQVRDGSMSKKSDVFFNET
jgi:hypothetical protein